ncbi:MAG: transposase [Gaiellaceae bacterium]
MAKTRRKRHHYTAAQRSMVLAAAQKEGLTALQVRRRFGVTPVTYYSWRKKLGVAARRGTTLRASGGPLGGQLRTAVQAKVREMLPDIVRGEVSSYLDQLFGSSRGRKLRT